MNEIIENENELNGFKLKWTWLAAPNQSPQTSMYTCTTSWVIMCQQNSIHNWKMEKELPSWSSETKQRIFLHDLKKTVIPSLKFCTVFKASWWLFLASNSGDPNHAWKCKTKSRKNYSLLNSRFSANHSLNLLRIFKTLET